MNRRIVNRLIAGLGVTVVAAALVLAAIALIGQKQAVENAAATVAAMRAVMPEPRNAVVDDRVNKDMAMLEIDGANYLGILEVPLYDCTLPIGAIWDDRNIARYPHRFAGSVYDGTLVIGGSDHTGQFDFMQVITGGDVLYITDVEGNRHAFLVEDILRTKDVSRENLCAAEYDLTLFVRNTYAFDYTVVRCNAKGK